MMTKTEEVYISVGRGDPDKFFILVLCMCAIPLVKSELRHLIIQAIRSQWELQDLPALGNQYHVMDDL